MVGRRPQVGDVRLAQQRQRRRDQAPDGPDLTAVGGARRVRSVIGAEQLVRRIQQMKFHATRAPLARSNTVAETIQRQRMRFPIPTMPASIAAGVRRLPLARARPHPYTAAAILGRRRLPGPCPGARYVDDERFLA